MVNFRARSLKFCIEAHIDPLQIKNKYSSTKSWRDCFLFFCVFYIFKFLTFYVFKLFNVFFTFLRSFFKHKFPLFRKITRRWPNLGWNAMWKVNKNMKSWIFLGLLYIFQLREALKKKRWKLGIQFQSPLANLGILNCYFFIGYLA